MKTTALIDKTGESFNEARAAVKQEQAECQKAWEALMEHKAQHGC